MKNIWTVCNRVEDSIVFQLTKVDQLIRHCSIQQFKILSEDEDDVDTDISYMSDNFLEDRDNELSDEEMELEKWAKNIMRWLNKKISRYQKIENKLIRAKNKYIDNLKKNIENWNNYYSVVTNRLLFTKKTYIRDRFGFEIELTI